MAASVLWDQQISKICLLYRKVFAHGQESVVGEEVPGRHVVSPTSATIAAVDFLTCILSDQG